MNGENVTDGSARFMILIQGSMGSDNAVYCTAVGALHTNVTRSIKIGSTLSDEFPVTKRLRKGCAKAPTLFRKYLNYSASEYSRCICYSMGKAINDKNLFTLHFLDDRCV